MKICNPTPFDRADEREGYPLIVEPKIDGVRLVSHATPDGTVRHYTRNGREVHGLEPLTRPYAAISAQLRRPVWVDSELASESPEMASGVARRPSLAAEGQWTAWAFDCLFGEVDLVPLHMRKKRLQGLTESRHLQVVKHEIADDLEDVLFWFEKATGSGGEGIVVKDPRAPHKPGRSGAWQKLKRVETFDLKVIGVVEGRGSYEGTAGALLCDFNGHQVRVGSGMTMRQRIEAFRMPPIGHVVEVEAMERTKAGSLRHPRFIRWRDDKSPLPQSEADQVPTGASVYTRIVFDGPRCGASLGREMAALEEADIQTGSMPHGPVYSWNAYQAIRSGRPGDQVAAMHWARAERAVIKKLSRDLPNGDLLQARLVMERW